MISHNNLFFLVVFILSLFGLSSVIAEEVSPRSTVGTLINSITSLKNITKESSIVLNVKISL